MQGSERIWNDCVTVFCCFLVCFSCFLLLLFLCLFLFVFLFSNPKRLCLKTMTWSTDAFGALVSERRLAANAPQECRGLFGLEKGKIRHELIVNAEFCCTKNSGVNCSLFWQATRPLCTINSFWCVCFRSKKHFSRRAHKLYAFFEQDQRIAKIEQAGTDSAAAIRSCRSHSNLVGVGSGRSKWNSDK